MPTFNTSLRDETRRLLKERPRTLVLQKIADDTGINIKWLAQFGSMIAESPCVNRVQTLYEYLSGKKLSL